MKENLIFGADICSFGAAGDGKTDCSEAFEKALSSEHNLITVPYGIYLIKKPLYIGSNTKLHVHPKARLIFRGVDGDSLVSNRDAEIGNSSIIISGGIWECTDQAEKSDGTCFAFKNVQNVRISQAEVHPSARTAVLLDNVCGFRAEKLRILSHDSTNCSDAIRLSGNCSDGIIRDISYSCNEMQSAPQAIISVCGQCENITADGILSDCCYSFIRLSDEALLSDSRFFNIKGGFLHCVLEFSCRSLCEDVSAEDIRAHSLKSQSDGAYLILSGNLRGLSAEGFIRDCETEAIPRIPSLRAEKCSGGASLIIDGIGLDDIINAKGMSKISSMLPARLANPQGKFIYTLEAQLKSDDSFIIPSGSFDLLEASPAE